MRKIVVSVLAVGAALAWLALGGASQGCIGGCNEPGTCLCADDSTGVAKHFPCDCQGLCASHGGQCTPGTVAQYQTFSDGGCDGSVDAGAADAGSADGG